MVSTIEKNNQLFPAVAAGDTAARDAMIEDNMALVVVKADAPIRRMPSVAVFARTILVRRPATSVWSRPLTRWPQARSRPQRPSIPIWDDR